MSIKIESVKTNEFEMEYFKFGRGDKTLVIIPGLSVQSVIDMADAVADAYDIFSSDYTVYVIDRRKDIPKGYTIADCARDTATSIDILDLNDMYMFGTSQGGMIIMQYAVDNPDKVRKMILASTCANITEDRYMAIDKWVKLAKERKTEELFISFGNDLYPKEIFKENYNLIVDPYKTVTDSQLDKFINMAEATIGFNVTDRIGQLDFPILAIGDKTDNVLFEESTLEIAKCFEGKDNFSMYMYDGYGHCVYDIAPDYKKRMYEFYRD